MITSGNAVAASRTASNIAFFAGSVHRASSRPSLSVQGITDGNASPST